MNSFKETADRIKETFADFQPTEMEQRELNMQTVRNRVIRDSVYEQLEDEKEINLDYVMDDLMNSEKFQQALRKVVEHHTYLIEPGVQEEIDEEHEEATNPHGYYGVSKHDFI